MSVLSLENYGVRYGPRTVLQSINLEVRPGEVLVVMGPGGSGKSTLVRTLCGLNDVIPTLTTQGRARYLGAELGDPRPAIVSQRLSWTQETTREVLCAALPERASLTPAEQDEHLATHLATLGLSELWERRLEPWWNLASWQTRALGLVRASLQKTPLLCVDEPSANLEEADRGRLMEVMAHLRARHTWIWVTHHQANAREFGDRVALLAGGTFQEVATARSFFESPLTQAAQSFVRTGGCDVPLTTPEAPAPRTAPPPEPLAPASPEAASLAPSAIARDRLTLSALYELPRAFPRASIGPRGFHWLIPGLLGGTPLPGWFHDLKLDVAALRRTGVQELITLTERPLPASQGWGFDVRHFPIVDMETPELEATLEMCRQVDALLSQGRPVVYHCKAGLGRTGTMLVAQLIYKGMPWRDALELARRVEKRWVQSPVQERFLRQLEASM